MIRKVIWIIPIVALLAFAAKPIVSHIAKEHASVKEKSKVVAISYYFPHFPYWADIVQGVSDPDPKLMDTYHQGKPYIFYTYYQKAVDLFPTNDAAHNLLGYCEYSRGNQDKARILYERALQLNPYFFWTYYNLGVIYLRNKEFDKGAMMFSKALKLNPQITMEIIKQDSFYRQIWKNLANPPEVLSRNLEQARQSATFFLQGCYLVSKGEKLPEELVKILDQKLQPRIF